MLSFKYFYPAKPPVAPIIIIFLLMCCFSRFGSFYPERSASDLAFGSTGGLLEITMHTGEGKYLSGSLHVHVQVYLAT